MSENNVIKKNVISGFFWKAIENGGDQLVTFFVSIVLARLLGPEKYGTMATMLVFITIGNCIVQNGFQVALIQKKEVTKEDSSSAFWASLALASVIYLIIFALAEPIAEFFEDIDIAPMLRVLGLMLFTGAFTSVEMALIARRMNFKVQCLATIFADVISGIIGVLSAFNGMGTWALILQQIIKNIFLVIFLLFGSGWFIRAEISLESLDKLFHYGWKVLLAGLIDTIYTNIYTPFISKLYDASTVGFYNRGNQFPQTLINSMASTVQGVMLPAFSKTQDDSMQARKMLRRMVKLSSFVMFPVMMGLGAISEPLIMLLLGSEWLEAAPLMRLCCLAYSVWHLHVVNLQAINANGRSDIFLELEVIKKIIGILVLIFSIRLGIRGMLLMRVIFDFVCVFINAFPNEKILGIGPIKQVWDVMPEFLLAIVMSLIVYGVRMGAVYLGLFPGADVFLWSSGSCLMLIITEIIVGATVYFAAAYLLKLESLRYLLETIGHFLKYDLTGKTKAK